MWMFRFRRFVRMAGREVLMLLFALRDPDTPRMVKLGTLFIIGYVVSPIDLVPDVLLLFGWADDLAVLMMGVPFLINRLPPAVQARAAFRVEELLARFGFRRG
jgi:uncharacterized membrane protein YkvA (DUF1232 family)